VRTTILVLTVLMLGAASNPSVGRPRQRRDAGAEHVRWVAAVLKHIGTITPGMTRRQLQTVFATEGGLFTGLRRTYVTRECGYFKVDVEFRPVGRPERDQDGRVTLVEDDRDIITNVSRPYLQWPILD
jgi:hypothetical protein